MHQGYFAFKHSKYSMVSTELCPLSTKSPMKMYLFSGRSPPLLKSSSTSKNYPWMSPQIFTGAFTGWTLLSSASNSLTFSQILRRSRSGRQYLPLRKFSKQPSMSNAPILQCFCLFSECFVFSLFFSCVLISFFYLFIIVSTGFTAAFHKLNTESEQNSSSIISNSQSISIMQ